MQLLESAIEKEVVQRARALGVVGVKLLPPGETGWPDRLFLIPGGRPLLIEFKRPGEKLRAKQAYTHRLLKSLDYDVEVHDDADTAVRAVSRAVAAAQVPEEVSAGLQRFYGVKK